MDMELPQKGPEHEELARLVGEWKGRERMLPSPWSPTEQERNSQISARMLEGFFLISDYEQRDADGQVCFRGHGVYGWDPRGELYTMYWVDSMGGPGGRAEGRLEGDVLTFENSSPMGHHRYRYTFEGSDAYTFEMAMSADGSNWHQLMEGHYERQ